MRVPTSRFGIVEIDADGIIRFPYGLTGCAEQTRWILLADAHHGDVAWLQNVEQPAPSFPLVQPHRFVPGYRLRVTRGQLAPLELGDSERPLVFAILSRADHVLTIDLRNPLVVQWQRRLGRQVLARGDESVQYALTGQTASLRKCA